MQHFTIIAKTWSDAPRTAAAEGRGPHVERSFEGSRLPGSIFTFMDMSRIHMQVPQIHSCVDRKCRVCEMDRSGSANG